MWTEAHGIHKSYLKVVEEKMVALLFTEACEMFLLSLDSEIVSLGDFRDQGINDFIMKHKSFFKMRLAISGFRFYSHWMTSKKGGERGEEEEGEKKW